MTKLCARGKSAAKRKFKVYPSAYANAYASKICAGKIKDPSGVKRKDFKGPKPAMKGGIMKYATGNQVKINKVVKGLKKASKTHAAQAKTLSTIKADKGIFADVKKKFIGPIRVSPNVSQQSSVEGKVKSDIKSLGVGVGTKFGNLNFRKSDTTESMSGYKDYKTKEKSVSYDKKIKMGKKYELSLGANTGKSKSNTGFKTKTKGVSATLTGYFSKGGGVAIKGTKFKGIF